MAGLLRNLITLLLALPRLGSAQVGDTLRKHFWASPFDAGIRNLKSDRYLQLAECAQLDFILRCGLLGRLVRGGIGFVNGSQLIRFRRPIRMLARLEVRSRVLWLDERWGWFEHQFHSRGEHCASVLVKMKFKQGALTVDPASLLARPDGPTPAQLQGWDQALVALASQDEQRPAN